MARGDSLPRCVAAGTVAGAAILGLGGRLITAAVAVGLGAHANLSAPGIAEAVLVGALGGSVGGAILAGVRRILPTLASRSLVTAAVLFAASGALAVASGRLDDGSEGARAVTLTAVFAVYVAFALTLEVWLSWRGAPRSTDRR